MHSKLTDANAIWRSPLRVIIIALLIGTLAAGCGGGKSNDGSSARASVSPSPQAAATVEPTPAPTEVPTPPPPPPIASLSSVAANDHLLIPKIGVDAPLSYHKVGPDGQMPNPAGEDDIAYYDFSGFPGFGGGPGLGGNSVFAGHVDSGFAPCKNGTVKLPCQSVLWDLGKLNKGDEIDVRVAGVTYKYTIVDSKPVSAANGDWNAVVASTPQEMLTVITCGGDFNPVTHEYSNRQVVTATRNL